MFDVCDEDGVVRNATALDKGIGAVTVNIFLRACAAYGRRRIAWY